MLSRTEAIPVENTTLWESHEMLANNGVCKYNYILHKTKIKFKERNTHKHDKPDYKDPEMGDCVAPSH